VRAIHYISLYEARHPPLRQTAVSSHFYFSVILSTNFFNNGTTVKPVGIDKQQPIKKSPNHIFIKFSCQPSRMSEMPKLITAVIEMDTSKANKIAPCVFESFIVAILIVVSLEYCWIFNVRCNPYNYQNYKSR